VKLDSFLPKDYSEPQTSQPTLTIKPTMALRTSLFRLSALHTRSIVPSLLQQRGKQTITYGIKSMLDEANKTVNTLTTEQGIELYKKADPNVVFVDLRDPRELEREGKVPGAVSWMTWTR
jgi:hypothetical protein